MTGICAFGHLEKLKMKVAGWASPHGDNRDFSPDYTSTKSLGSRDDGQIDVCCRRNFRSSV
jgi:hypothetical protein